MYVLCADMSSSRVYLVRDFTVHKHMRVPMYIPRVLKCWRALLAGILVRRSRQERTSGGHRGVLP